MVEARSLQGYNPETMQPGRSSPLLPPATLQNPGFLGETDEFSSEPAATAISSSDDELGGMAGSSRNRLPPWMSAASSRVDVDGAPKVHTPGASSPAPPVRGPADSRMSYRERAVSAASAAFLSAILVNPLDVAKTRLQAQAAGVPYYPNQQHVGMQAVSLGPTTNFSAIRYPPSCHHCGLGSRMIGPPSCLEYKGTLDVLSKIIRHEGFARLWRGTNAGMAVAIPTVGIYLPCYDIFRNWIEDFAAQNAPTLTPYAPLAAGAAARSLACIACSPIELARTRMQAFKEFGSGAKLPGMWKTLLSVLSPLKNARNGSVASALRLKYWVLDMLNLNKREMLRLICIAWKSYRILWIGLGAQLSRDVPFSTICWSTLEPIRRRLLGLVGEGNNASCVFGANFAAGFTSGSLAAAFTCPLDVAKTRRQIEKDLTRALKMTARETLLEVWRDQGMKGLFTGLGPRVTRAGPSVGLVVSFYEVVKYALHRKNSSS